MAVSALNDNVEVKAPKLIDNRSNLNGFAAYGSLTQAIARVRKEYRAPGLTVNILKPTQKGLVLTEYWWRDGVEDFQLIEKFPPYEFGNLKVYMSDDDYQVDVDFIPTGPSIIYFTGNTILNSNLPGILSKKDQYVFFHNLSANIVTIHGVSWIPNINGIGGVGQTIRILPGAAVMVYCHTDALGIQPTAIMYINLINWGSGVTVPIVSTLYYTCSGTEGQSVTFPQLVGKPVHLLFLDGTVRTVRVDAIPTGNEVAYDQVTGTFTLPAGLTFSEEVPLVTSYGNFIIYSDSRIVLEVTTDDQVAIPTDIIVEKIYIKSDTNATIEVGTTPSGAEIAGPEDLTGGTAAILVVEKPVETPGTTFYFTGITGPTKIILYTNSII